MDKHGPGLNNTWLAGPKPTGLLPRAALEDRILNLLSTMNMAVIATVAPDGAPAATPVRYSSLGMENHVHELERVREIAQPPAGRAACSPRSSRH